MEPEGVDPPLDASACWPFTACKISIWLISASVWPSLRNRSRSASSCVATCAPYARPESPQSLGDARNPRKPLRKNLLPASIIAVYDQFLVEKNNNK
jgi:hypothetical protein